MKAQLFILSAIAVFLGSCQQDVVLPETVNPSTPGTELRDQFHEDAIENIQDRWDCFDVNLFLDMSGTATIDLTVINAPQKDEPMYELEAYGEVHSEKWGIGRSTFSFRYGLDSKTIEGQFIARFNGAVLEQTFAGPAVPVQGDGGYFFRLDLADASLQIVEDSYKLKEGNIAIRVPHMTKGEINVDAVTQGYYCIQ